MEWRNWSGAVACAPRRILAPADVAGIRAAVAGAAAEGLSVRVAGSGHSFAPLVATEGVLLDLSGFAGIEAADAAARTARIRAGTVIRDFGDGLRQAGLALANQGDIDVQALAGAIATGTHGTGRRLGNLSSMVRALQVVGPGGETVEIEGGELLSAARLSLGLFGVVCTVTLDLLPAYRLVERCWTAPFETVMAGLEAAVAGNRHFEFFWRPASDACDAKALNPEEALPPPVEGAAERTDWSWRIFPSIRANRFNEMEFTVPAAAGPGCFRELRQLMRSRHPQVRWPVEYRTQAADEVWLSPCWRRDGVTLSIHQDASLPHEAFFRDAQAVFLNHGGRPHWGKMHWLTPAQYAEAFPKLSDAARLRRGFDPAGRFLNDFLRPIFG